MVGQIIIGLAIITTGTFLVVKSEWFVYNIGRIAWFEANLGSEGGTRLGYKLIGILLVIIGIIITTGSGDSFLTWLLAPILRYR